jgi:LCP family protein required for cell wall assembly
MKTTLKRGASRSANGTGNGNGSGNGAGVLPPSPFTATSRYGPRRRSPFALVGKIVLWIVMTVLVTAGGVAGGFWLYAEHAVAETRPSTPEERKAQELLDDIAPPTEPQIAIVIGYDKRFTGPEAGGESRSDTILLIRTDPGTNTISLLSFPRDLYVELAPCEGFSERTGRINQAWAECGPAGTIQTVRNLTGLPINYFITVNFRGFVKIIERAYGGIYVDVDRRYLNTNEGLGYGQTYAPINLRAGYQRLNGTDALRYVRYRHTDNDFYRNARQQEFVKAVKQQTSGLESVLRLPGIVDVVARNVTIGQGGAGEIELETVLQYARFAYELPSGNFFQVRINNLADDGAFNVIASEESIQEAVDSFINPDPEAPEKAAAAALGGRPRSSTRSGPPPAEVSVEVMNGNGVAGAAGDAAYRLSQRGYRAVSGGNADRQDYFKTQILYDPATDGAQGAAEDMAKLFGDAEVVEAPPGELETTLRVLVGKTFGGSLTPIPRDNTPRHEPPKVVTDPASITPLARQAQAQLDFPVLVPTVREQSSLLSTVEPMRVYRLRGDKTVRFVFNGPLSTDYWGIQQTSWTDAPILEGPTMTRSIGGREYRLYFNGSHIHMIAFIENETAYWVTNTLLDNLSNETMLAIAKGLKPLRR